MAKHLAHVVLVASALVVLRLANIELSAVALVVLLAACLVLFEGGLSLIRRRDERRAAASASTVSR